MSNRYSGVVGYGETVETAPDVFRKIVVERPALGDVFRNSRSLEEGGSKANNDLSVGNSISIVADPYANEHFFNIRYVMWQGARWTVSKVDVEPPRLVLRLGALYNGPLPEGV